MSKHPSLLLDPIPKDFYSSKKEKSWEALIQPWEDVLTLCAGPSDGWLLDGALSGSYSRDKFYISPIQQSMDNTCSNTNQSGSDLGASFNDQDSGVDLTVYHHNMRNSSRDLEATESVVLVHHQTQGWISSDDRDD